MADNKVPVLLEIMPTYVSDSVLVEIGESYTDMIGKDIDFLMYKNYHGEPGLLSAMYHTMVPNIFTKEQYNRVDPTWKKDYIRNFDEYRDMPMVVITNSYKLGRGLIKAYRDRVSAIYYIQDNKLHSVFLNVDDYLLFAKYVADDNSYNYKYQVIKTRDIDNYSFIYFDNETREFRSTTLDLNKLKDIKSYMDLGDIDLNRVEDPTAEAESRWRNYTYSFNEYAGNDNAKVVSGGLADHLDTSICKNTYVKTPYAKDLYMTLNELHDRIMYMDAVERMIRGHKISRKKFYDLDVIKCPHCKGYMKYRLTTTYSSCSHCGETLPNPKYAISYKKDKGDTPQDVANHHYAIMGYESYDCIKCKSEDTNPDWIGDNDPYLESYLEGLSYFEESEDSEDGWASEED